jgi:DNA polymerase III subunit alpha, Gram-positive type
MINKRIDEIEFVVLDLETTGFSPRTGDEIVEIGALKISGCEIVDTFQSLVNPRRPMNSHATAVNGITNNMLKNAPLIVEVLPRFLEFAGGAPFIIHNAAFDLPFIAWKTRELGLPANSNIVLDTLLLSRALNPGFQNHKLYTIIEKMNLQLQPAHRALADSTAAWHIFKRMALPLGNGSPPPLAHVLAAQGGPFRWPAVYLPPK